VEKVGRLKRKMYEMDSTWWDRRKRIIIIKHGAQDEF
jgi:hypothetical protein